MKDILKLVFMFLCVLVVYIYKNDISNFILDNVVYGGNNKVLTYNEYYLDHDYSYVQNVDNISADDYQQVLNIFYTVLNSGDTNFSFKCNYNNCLNDVKDIIDSKSTLSNINNFVHPYNSYSSINIDLVNSGKVTIKSNKLYSSRQIEALNSFIDNFIANNIKDDMSNIEKIKVFHDYIVNTTEYDKNDEYNSHTAYDLINNHKSICGGYSDIMAIYLNALGIQNYKISSENHVWNLINLDGTWYHLDMTWDDPIASDGNQYLLHNFFLISTSELLNLDKIEHNFDYNVYKEATN